MTLGDGDLPAKEFDEKWKQVTDFSTFENAVNLNKKIDDMEKWILHFDGEIVNIYDAKSMGTLSHMLKKRCRDLNFYINYVLHHIPKITKDSENSAQLKAQFQNFIKAKFMAWEKFNSMATFKCKLEMKEYTDKMYIIKALDDYCENRNALKNKLHVYNKKACCQYANHINSNKSSFSDLILADKVKKDDKDFNIEDKCTLEKFGETFPSVVCNEEDMSEIVSDKLQIPHRHEHLSGTYSEDSFSSSPTKIALTSVSTLLGACLSGLYLYRHSFKGHRQRNYESENIFSHENIYDKETGMFSDSPGDVNQFYKGYDPI
ncbi:PIR Superfamily Protein [Plasmodium ovale curtisi]|uniref:PIR Superfamily Protein n=1 Tax=Plasmodium ovale curtisi TaxID=864141 RepID=A0A1A8XBN5_PLAOA|nr:PIR Superfamily Protein [Plasmodium ovale curtisi]SBT01274.1 PIR Superfamily Protein [Plasmodium ovale curtisi]